MIKFSKTNRKYGCFSNFFSCPVEYEGITYPNSECAWQSLKTLDKTDRERFAAYTAAGAKKMGRKLSLRPDWEDVKYPLMVDVCFAKFSQNKNLKELLLSTGDEELLEDTTGWHDNTWGNCDCDKCKDIKGKNLLGKALMEVRDRLKKSREYNEKEIREDYRKLTKLLIERKMTITTMESATSGQIASLITDTEGSSAVLKGAFITYCNEAKIMQGVPADILEKYTVYSKETAEAMAEACCKAYGADVGIGVTGTMGNVDPANPEASVPGQVYFSIKIGNKNMSYYIELEPQPSRLMYKLAVAKEIYDVLMERLAVL